jgi:release factor glutamine methyltransferase
MSLEIREILQIAEARLADAGRDEAKLHAEALLCHLLGADRKELFMRWSGILSDNGCDAYFSLVDERAGGRPLQYITGEQEFMGITFHVDERTLIPRQDTEALVEAALAFMAGEKAPMGGWRVLDVGTGCGAIAVSLCKHNGDVSATACDVSPGALEVARRNAIDAEVAGRVKFVESDFFSAFGRGAMAAKFNIIASNPPYIRSGDIARLQPEILHEPRLALDGGEDGMDAYRRIAGGVCAHLKKGGMIFLETGFGQAAAVSALIESTGRFGPVETLKDLGGNDRVAAARLKDKARG